MALADAYLARPPAERPRLWFTYHVYYKAPDLIGPVVARRLGIPYLVAEGSRSPKRAAGPWARGHAQAEAALDAARVILVLNERDRPALAAAQPASQRLVPFPPFLDPAVWPAAPREATAGPLRLLTVAMMRAGDKRASYDLLAQALELAADLPWTLDIVGDGPARAAVEARFSGLGDRVRWHGLVTDRAVLGSYYAGADLLVWPAVNEAFGMIFLEAALHGCPALAGDFGGVRGVVRPGETGVIVAPGDASALAAALVDLAQPGRLAPLSAAARRFVLGERTLDVAAARLAAIIAETLSAWEGRA
ncbi:glycosyltransferase family 4 protein [Oleomonas cavernae]|uniref:glycosyltransferase family 4 protein n=1 Tax=Oleomonas cavernae TaxID=2320859 RepID=UPI0018F4A923|nr:glycosyltransferase family 4 protein [Oleomonas cavernae]